MRASPLSVSEISARLARHLCLQEGRTPRHRFSRILRLNDLKSPKRQHLLAPDLCASLQEQRSSRSTSCGREELFERQIHSEPNQNRLHRKCWSCKRAE